ncbi:ABC transporter permease [Paenibacillus lutrae]|uniref:ABC transporter permease n=1 Tax=Paenibacillus lutrae TaxID=2078573 RepID=A0A7X3FHQ3_9BACL|nr:ABC transporter permease [Paenibacillus lutrae]MVO99864.1 ABC transporter permease [Paenibacillus lutrae]
MNNMMTVIRFTLFNRLKTKSFKISTLIFVLMISLVVNLPAIMESFAQDDGDKAVKVGVMAAKPELSEQLTQYFAKAQEGGLTAKIEIVPMNRADSAEAENALIREKLKAEEVKGVLVAAEAAQGEFPALVYKTEDAGFSLSSGGDSTAVALQTALQTIKMNAAVIQSGIDSAVLAKIQEPVKLTSESISVNENPVKSKEEMGIAFVLVYALLFLLYMSVIGYGSMVSTEITAEKSSRVMEILISSGSPLKQMFGKIIGICLLGLLQLVLIGVVVAVNLMFPWNVDVIKDMNIDLSLLPLDLLAYFLLFYLGGFFIYATIFAAIGSLVSRSEEVQQAVMPVTILIIVAFMSAMFGLQNPDAPFVVVMSFIPFFSPLIMFLRIGLGTPAAWEIILSIGIMLGSIFALGWLAAKIYRTGVLMYGKRPSWKELRKAMKAFEG